MKHSDRAKKGTSSQIDGIINFLESQLETYERESKVYADRMFIDFRKAIDKNVETTKKSLKYYKKLKEDYFKNGLI